MHILVEHHTYYVSYADGSSNRSCEHELLLTNTTVHTTNTTVDYEDEEEVNNDTHSEGNVTKYVGIKPYLTAFLQNRKHPLLHCHLITR